MQPKNRILFALLLILAVLIGLPAWLTWREVRQERLNWDLIAAIKQNDTATALALWKAGADANAEDKGNMSVSARQVLRDWWDHLRGRKPATSHPAALIVASKIYSYSPTDKTMIPPENVALFQALLDHGAVPNTRDEHGQSALTLAAMYGHTATARLLLDHGADIHARDQDGATVLMWGNDLFSRGMTELLLDRGADIEARDNSGRTALMYAVGRNDAEAVGVLLAHGANVNVRNDGGLTALMGGVSTADPAVIQLLLDKGADVTVKTGEDMTALKAAQMFGKKVNMRLLKLHGAKE